MNHEVLDLKNMVAEFISRLAYESQHLERKLNGKIDLLLAKIKEQEHFLADIKDKNLNLMKSPAQVNKDHNTETKQIFIYPKDAAKLLGVGTTKFYQLNKLSTLPKPKNPLGKRVIYLRSEIEAWVSNL